MREAQSLLTQFDIRTWHALIDYVNVMPDKTLVYYFRNDVDQIVMLDDVRETM